MDPILLCIQPISRELCLTDLRRVFKRCFSNCSYMCQLSIPFSCDKYLKSDYSIISSGHHILRVLCVLCLFCLVDIYFSFFFSHDCRFGRSPGLPYRCYGLGSNYTRIHLGIRIPGDFLLHSLGSHNLPYRTSVQYS